MKFTPSRNTVISTSKTSQFTMAVNAKSFSILTSGIYKNKIKAVIREYSTNALDSHIEARNPDPFEVHLPTVKECYFYVRDYGTGLDEDQFESVFFKFFESTKDQSNEFNGTMGLGSKSLYSYNTKSFTVESWKDGYHYIYSCFIGPSGVPEYSQLLKEYSQDPEGIKIQAPVNPEDIDEFEENAKEVYKYFERKPKFIGKQIDLKNVYLDKKKHYALRSNTNYYNRGCYAVMGNVAYPIESNYALNKHQKLIDSNILLFFDIGELTFTPSRESLEYTDYTIKSLKNKFNEVLEEINEDIVSQINSAKTEFSAVKLFNSLYQKYSKNINGLEKPSKLEWNGKTLNTNPIEINHIIFDFTRKRGYNRSKVNIQDYQYVINDMKIGAITRSSEFRTSSDKVVCLIQESDLSNIGLSYNDDDFIKASTLPSLPKKTKKRSSLSSFSEMVESYYVTESWKPIDVNDAESKYYIVRNGYRPVYNGLKEDSKKVYRWAKQAGIKDKIYGVSEKQEQKIKDLGFTNIYDAIVEKSKAIIKELDDNKDLIIKLYTEHDFLQGYNNAFNNFEKVANKYDISNTPINKFLEFKKNFDNKLYQKYQDKICGLLKMGEKYEIKRNNNLVKEYVDIIKQYPLCGNHIGYYHNIKVEDLYYYILGVSYASGNI